MPVYVSNCTRIMLFSADGRRYRHSRNLPACLWRSWRHRVCGATYGGVNLRCWVSSIPYSWRYACGDQIIQARCRRQTNISQSASLPTFLLHMPPSPCHYERVMSYHLMYLRESYGSVESVKAANDVYMPVGGEVVEVNSVSTAQCDTTPHLTTLHHISMTMTHIYTVW